MRRLMALAVTISLRVIFAAMVTVWVWAQYQTFVALNAIGTVYITARGLEIARVPVQRPLEFWAGDREQVWDYLGEMVFEQSETPTITKYTGVVVRRSSPTTHAVGFSVAVRHWTLVSIALVANVLHWLYHRRKRKAVPCDD